MILRFQYMLAVADRARKTIERAGLDLCGDSLTEYARIKRQFCIMDDLDVFIDDDMPETEYGYILKCLMTVGLNRHEIIVPRKSGVCVPDPEPSGTSSEAGACRSEGDNILSIDDYLPPEAFDDGHFEEEMEDILRMDDSPDNDEE